MFSFKKVKNLINYVGKNNIKIITLFSKTFIYFEIMSIVC